MYINWAYDFYIDPTTLEPTTSTDDTFLFPTYANYGGPNYTAGVLTTEAGPVQVGGTNALDSLDALFLIHDTTGDDFALAAGIATMDTSQLDAEGQLYAGIALLAMIEQLAVDGQLDQVDPSLVTFGLNVAYQDIQSGYDGLNFIEALAFQSVLAYDLSVLV